MSSCVTFCRFMSVGDIDIFAHSVNYCGVGIFLLYSCARIGLLVVYFCDSDHVEVT